MDDSGVYQLAEREIWRMVPYQTPAERRMSVSRLRGFRRDLAKELRELEADLERRYEELTPKRAAKYPDIFGRKWEAFTDVEAQYRKVADIIVEIDRRCQEAKEAQVGEEERSEERSAVVGPSPEQRELFAVLG